MRIGFLTLLFFSLCLCLWWRRRYVPHEVFHHLSFFLPQTHYHYSLTLCCLRQQLVLPVKVVCLVLWLDRRTPSWVSSSLVVKPSLCPMMINKKKKNTSYILLPRNELPTTDLSLCTSVFSFFGINNLISGRWGRKKMRRGKRDLSFNLPSSFLCLLKQESSRVFHHEIETESGLQLKDEGFRGKKMERKKSTARTGWWCDEDEKKKRKKHQGMEKRQWWKIPCNKKREKTDRERENRLKASHKETEKKKISSRTREGRDEEMMNSMI